MTSRQRMLNRSGAVEPKRVVCCWWVPARTVGGTRTAAVVTLANGDVDNDNFEPSAGDSFDRGLGAGAESFAAQLQEAPCEHWPWQQQAPAPWYRSSVRAVRNLRWICCNTMARSAIRDRSSDMPEPVPRQSNPRAPQLTAVSGCHSCRRSGAELPREPARRPAKQELGRQCCCGVARLNHMHGVFADNHICAGLTNARTIHWIDIERSQLYGFTPIKSTLPQNSVRHTAIEKHASTETIARDGFAKNIYHCV